MGMFDGKRALVTGASQGIGNAIAEALATAGAHVTGTFCSSAEEAQAMSEAGFTLHQADFSTREGTLQFLGLLDSAPPFDFVVNNAGIVDFELISDFTAASWDRTFEVNVNAPLLITVAAAKSMPASGAVVNIASTDGYTGSFGSIAYSASKAALINLTKSLGNIYGERGIRVNAVAPGWVDTGMSTDESYEATTLTPLGRNGTPADIAEAVYFLLSPAAAFVNGATLIVDGGYTNVDPIMKKERDALTED